MEAQNKDKTAKTKNKIKFSFENLKIRNKIFFGFFVVSIMSGLANYYSNSFIVNEFRAVNNSMHMFHRTFALQKKMELMVESYVTSEVNAGVSEKELDGLQNEIEVEFNGFLKSGGSFLEKGLTDRFINESGTFFEKEYEVIAVHKREIDARNVLAGLQAQEKENRYIIREYVNSLSDPQIYTAFLYAEYLSKEMLYQYKDNDHAKKWLDALEAANKVAIAKSVDITVYKDYYDISSRTSESVIQLNLIEQEQAKKIEEFRFAIEDLNTIQDEVSQAITNQNLKEIDTVVFLGVLIFILILILFTFFFGYFISNLISRPIKELSQFALMAARGDFKHRIRVDSDDEIGQTAKAFNLVLDKVEESTVVLETKVKARTKRLEELSRDLELQIDNKTKELNDKIAELERFNDLAVGRELRMVELKKEIEILRQGVSIDDKWRADYRKKNSNDKTLNCWDYWDCKKEVRDKCPAYISNSGRECWVISSGKCPRSKERGFEDCKECAWYKKMNGQHN